MNTAVSFEIAKLLKEKDWNKPTLNFYFEDGESKENVFKDIVGMDYGSEFTIEFSELIENWNDEWLTKKNGDRCFGCSKSQGYFETFSAPTISDVIMWLYKKYEIWIEVYYDNSKKEFYTVLNGEEYKFKTPTKAYESAIEYTLKNLV